jgi:uncharacterized membrane protein YdjX (TVP38/TMEM64 family)
MARGYTVHMRLAYLIGISSLLGLLFTLSVETLGPEVVAGWFEKTDQLSESIWTGVVLAFLIWLGASTILIPISGLLAAGGFVYGWWFYPPSILILTVGSVLGYGMGRRLGARPKVQGYEEDKSQKKKLQKALDLLDSRPVRVVFLLRVFPAIPFLLQNLLLGARSIPFSKYLIGTVPAITGMNAVMVAAGVTSRTLVGRIVEFVPAGYVVSCCGLVLGLSLGLWHKKRPAEAGQ